MPVYRAFLAHINSESFTADLNDCLGDTPSTYAWITGDTGRIRAAFDRAVIAGIPDDETLLGITWNYEIGSTSATCRISLGIDSSSSSLPEYAKWFGPEDVAVSGSSSEAFQETGIGPSTIAQLKSEGLGITFQTRFTRAYRAYVDIETQQAFNPTKTLYASSHITGDVLSPDNALGAPDGVTTQNSGKSGWTSRWAMEDPGGALVGAQKVTVRLRRASEGGGSNPTVDIDLYENGTKVADLISGQVSLATLAYTADAFFEDTDITDPSNVEVWINGSETYQAAVQVDAIVWEAGVEESSKVNVWTGTEWKPLTVWDGSTWNPEVRVWTGTEWVPEAPPETGTAVGYGIAERGGNFGNVLDRSNALGSDTGTYAETDTNATFYINIDPAPFQAIPAGATITGMRAYGYVSNVGGDLDYCINGNYELFVSAPSDGWYEFVLDAQTRPTLALLQTGGDAGVNIGLSITTFADRLHAVRFEVDWEG